MTDKELTKLSKKELYDLLLKQELEIEKLTAKNEELAELQMRQEQKGSLAEASIEVSGIIQAAQKAADVYLSRIKAAEQNAVTAAAALDGDERVRELQSIEYKNTLLKEELERLVRDIIRTFNNQLNSFSEMRARLSELIEENNLYHLLHAGEQENGKK